jgi:hypothetical protein
MPGLKKSFQMSQAGLDETDKCTLVSIVPFLISEFKPGIYPGRFVLNPCMDFNKPETLEVGQSIYFIPQFNGDEELPAHVIKTPSKEIAASVVNDYMSGQMDIDIDCRPGLCYIPGVLGKIGFPVLHADLYQKMKKDQNAWFGKLVQRADNDWNRYKRHTVISDNQRFAAKALGMTKDWMTTESADIPVKCPSCMTNCNPKAIVCANCRCILNVEKHKTLSFAA